MYNYQIDKTWRTKYLYGLTPSRALFQLRKTAPLSIFLNYLIKTRAKKRENERMNEFE